MKLKGLLKETRTEMLMGWLKGWLMAKHSARPRRLEIVTAKLKVRRKAKRLVRLMEMLMD